MIRVLCQALAGAYLRGSHWMLAHQLDTMLATRPILVQRSQLRLIKRIQMHLLLLVKNFTEVIS